MAVLGNNSPATILFAVIGAFVGLFIGCKIAHEIYSAQFLITGMVSDVQGNPMTGVIVTEKGKPNRVSTDEKGIYSISTSNMSAILIFSLDDYMTNEIAFEDQTVIDAVMYQRPTKI